MRSATGLVLVLSFAGFADSVCHAQPNPSRNAPSDQTLCSLLTKADAESILGEPAAAGPDICREF